VLEATMGDRQVVDAVLAGDREAFRVLVERESQAVIAVCRRILGDPVEAQDAAQDAFSQAFQALATFRGDGPFGAWLHRIAVRAAIARLAARRDLVTLDGEALELRATLPASGDDPEAVALDGEDRAAILAAVSALPEGQRDVVLLRFYGDLSLDEIAEATQHPIGTVKSRLSRAVASLRDQLVTRSAP
jgi:RNA polymerase sigma-70 factor (ECF subfamily)